MCLRRKASRSPRSDGPVPVFDVLAMSSVCGYAHDAVSIFFLRIFVNAKLQKKQIIRQNCMLNFINFKNIAEKPSVLVAKYIFCNHPAMCRAFVDNEMMSLCDTTTNGGIVSGLLRHNGSSTSMCYDSSSTHLHRFPGVLHPPIPSCYPRNCLWLWFCHRRHLPVC